MNCRLCDKDITGKNGLILYDYKENIETKLGRKIHIILNSFENHQDLSNYCCYNCSCKIEICFSLLVEIQASDEVIRQTYKTLANGKKIDTTLQVYSCGECNKTISGIEPYIKHYENHILEKTTIGSKKDITISAIDPVDENVENNMCLLTEEMKGSTYYQNNYNVNENDLLSLDEIKYELEETESVEYGDGDNVSEAFDEFFNVENDSNENEVEFEVDDNLYELTPLSPDEFDDFNDPTDEADVGILDFKNNFDESNNSKINSIDTVNYDNADIKSEDSFNSDISFKNLVDIVKKELECDDEHDGGGGNEFDDDDIEDDDDSFDISPNKDGLYSCKDCNLAFEYKFVLKLHIKKDHLEFHDLDVSAIKSLTDVLSDGNGPFLKCCYCKEVLSSLDIKNHVQECRQEYYLNRKMLCQVCGKLCRCTDLKKHLKDHKQLMWSCGLCGKKFKAKRFLKSHFGEHDESKKKICEICGKKLLPLSFFSHVMKHREKRHVCQFCKKAFTYNYGLRMHLKVHGDKKLEPKQEKKKDKVFCWLCKKDFDCTIALNKHLKDDHNAEGVEQDSRFPCSQCDKKFADMFSLKAHLKLIHEMKDEEIACLKSLPVYRYIECNLCSKVFNSENKIRIHMKQDHGLKPFEMEILKKECEKCGKKFASKQNLIHHINGAHLHIKPMTCDICHEKFAKHSSLIYHKLRHSGEKPFQCEFCQKSYRQRNDVIRHLARHVRDKELTLEEASAVNNSPSRLVIKRRIFLKDSSINYQKIIRKSRRKTGILEMEPILDEELNDIQEEQMEFNENGMSESMIYVEEVQIDENQGDSPPVVSYTNIKPVYNEERNTIVLSSPDDPLKRII